MSLQHIPDSVKHGVDAAAVVTAAGALAQILPPIAALLSIIWITIQIYDRVRHGPKRKP